MMNGGGGGPGQPPMPMHPGRGQHDMPFNPQHYGPYPPQSYQQHPQQYFHQQYHQYPQHPPNWQYYQNMQPTYRPYPHGYQAPRGYPGPNLPPVVLPPHSMTSRPVVQVPSSHIPPSPRSHNTFSPPPPAERSIPPNVRFATPPVAAASTATPPPIVSTPPSRKIPFYPNLPWYSDSTSIFPPKARRRRRRFVPQSPSRPVVLPSRGNASEVESSPPLQTSMTAQQGREPMNAVKTASSLPPETQSAPEENIPQQESVIDIVETQQTVTKTLSLQTQVEIPQPGTRSTSQAPSENNSTQPTTPSSVQPPRSVGSTSTVRPSGKLVPVVPVVPNIPGLSKSRRKESVSTVSETVRSISQNGLDSPSQLGDASSSATEPESVKITPEQEQPATKIAPKSWADLVRSKASAAQQDNIVAPDSNLTQASDVSSKGSLADALRKFSAQKPGEAGKLAFVKPRGLINTGNMCYMNAVLQVLLYCTPFYDFLEKVSKNAAHSFKSETPMLDAMILFIQEFGVIDAANSAEQLRMRLKSEEFEQYGEPFTPGFVYEVIRQLPRFASMRRGHQQDAEEFLGFLLEELHEECARSIKDTNITTKDELVSPVTEGPHSEDGWHEVGPKQRAAVTRTSGYTNAESPITKIFGGTLRSEFRVPGTKNSVTFEPYQPLQLDIGSPHTNNIIDALKGLTRSEVIHGDFNSPRGPGATATKQVFIENLPQVLILHLKRFQYDNAGGTQKIWKKVGYPLELEIPKEVFPQHKRGGFAVKGGLPKYRLISVVYHHGKSASGGHYTVDVRRQDGLEWIRLDDTIIRRVRSEDIAEGGSEEDPKILAAALEQHKRDQSSSSNIFDQVRQEHEESAEAEKGWSHVNGSSHGGSTSKKWSGVVNGTSTPTLSSGKRTPVQKSSVKDNKVAYILFYQRI